jgi:hypothetical protein
MKTKCLLALIGLVLAGCATHTDTAGTPRPGPTLDEVKSLVKAHVGDLVIISQIQNSSTRYALTADQIIALKKDGVSDSVIITLINTATNSPPRTTVIREVYPYPYYYGDPWWGWGPSFRGYYYYRGPNQHGH